MEQSPARIARIAGLLYLLIFITAGFSEGAVRGTLIDFSDPAALLEGINDYVETAVAHQVEGLSQDRYGYRNSQLFLGTFIGHLNAPNVILRMHKKTFVKSKDYIAWLTLVPLTSHALSSVRAILTPFRVHHHQSSP